MTASQVFILKACGVSKRPVKTLPKYTSSANAIKREIENHTAPDPKLLKCVNKIDESDGTFALSKERIDDEERLAKENKSIVV